MERSFDEAFHDSDGERGVSKGVCFGALYDGFALPYHDQYRFDEHTFVESLGCEDVFVFDIRSSEGQYTLCWPDKGGSFAALDAHCSAQLRVIDDVYPVRFHGVVEKTAIIKRKKGNTRKVESVALSINIYGQPSDAEEIGHKLSAASAFLQHPKSLPKEIDYCNPHFWNFSEDEEDTKALVGITNDSPSARQARISDEISSILECLGESPRSTDFDYGRLNGLLSQLKPHQQHGVRFMIQREAQHEQSQYGQESGRLMTSCGGIIADVMGLGKTLTVLASILYSASDAEAFQRSTLTTSDTQEFQLYTKATLVVVSSTQLLDSWCSEVKRHFDPGVLNISMFHGLSRQQDLRALAGSDIVLTTYATIVAEEKGKNTLQQLYWFRIVLDEAHWIRNARSKTFRAVTGLLARNRWCLTGTPVQNKLEDIASLAAFLQLQPFPTKGEFQRRVLDPLFQGGNNFSKPLRTWLRAVCIRRTEKLLQLPESKEETISVILSPPERQLYDRVLYEIKHDIDDNVSKGKNIKNYNILFISILRMRMLCNSGTLSKPSSHDRHLDSSRKREAVCERCTGFDDQDSALLLTDFRFCPDCGRSLQISSPVTSFGSDRDGNSPLPAPTPFPEDMLPSTGHSAKLFAIKKVIKSDLTSNHIVFSYWTSTLDLLSILLGNAAVDHVQVDGRTNSLERLQKFERFRQDENLHVLLMSIETGALGLNLTVANRVHIVEPQWNPSVEEQAVARALRMGQEREVTVFRYVAQGTVEQNIMHLQKKKKSVAKFMFNVGVAEELNGRLEDLKFVLSLNSKPKS